MILLVTLFHRSIDRAILLVTLLRQLLLLVTFGDTFASTPTLWQLLVTLLRHLRLPKIDFGTFQLGIAQLVPRVSGSPRGFVARRNSNGLFTH